MTVVKPLNAKLSPGLMAELLGGASVWTAGAGPTLLVVHGGPGLDHTYLSGALLPLSSDFRLVFYDQRGVGPRGGRVTAGAQVRQLRALLAALPAQGRTAVLAHSWGNYLVYACLAHGPAAGLRGAILVSPVGLTRERFEASLQRQAQRFPPTLQVALRAPAGLDLSLLRKLTPYYLAPQNRGKVRIPMDFYDGVTGREVIGSLPDYDFRSLRPRLPRATHLIYGADEADVPADTSEIHAGARVTTLPGAGHFPFAERPVAFQRLVRETLLS